MRKKNIIFIFIIIFILVLGFAIFLQNKYKKSNSSEQQITIAEFGEVFLYAPLYIADAKGFFKDQGLDVRIVPTGGDDKTFSALLSGDAQFGVADPTFAVISGEKGQPGKVVASILNGVPFWGITNNKEIKEITKPADLKNYRVATFPAPSTAYTLQKKMFESADLKPNIKEAAFGSLIAALKAGKADIALELEPNVSTAVEEGDRILYSLSSYYPEFAITGLTVLPEYAQKNPETIQRVVNAIQEADYYLHSNPAECARILVKRFPDVKEEIALNAVNNMIRANVFPKSTMVTKEAWDEAIKLRKEVGDIKSDGSYDEYVINNFSKNAK